ncbi:MAG: hypothetical protein JWN14_4481 [Chthonomonadales bacterium]|nr:hypothetical protein [Chthonomonadales bacterium]
MANPLRRYDLYWSNFNADILKRMSTVWGAPAKMPKEERIAYLITVPQDPQQIDAALERMLPFERAALSLLQWVGGIAEIRTLSITVRTTGLAHSGERYTRSYGSDPVAQTLLDHGIVMPEGGQQYFGSGYYSDKNRVFADERVLDRVRPTDFMPLSIPSTDSPTSSTVRRVPSVMLDIISFLRAIDDLGGIGLTQAGVPRVNDMRKLARKLGWGETIEIDGLTFLEPANAYLLAVVDGGLLIRKNEGVVNSTPPDQIGRSPVVEVVRNVIMALLQTGEWMEVALPYMFSAYKYNVPATRFAVLTALRCLPDSAGWFRFSDFERALFERIGEFHSAADIKSRPSFYRETPAEQRVQLETWKQEIRTAWEKKDVVWIQAMFQSWMYAFGLVELQVVDGSVERFRLTDLGRAILWDEPLPEQTQPGETQTSAWIVQPNFEMVVFLASAAMEQIAFLEQYAERVQIAQHTAQYKLTRDSVYEGLQRGGSADQLMEGLLAGSRVGLPDNVTFEIRNWATLRERITIRQRADLIEFSNETERRNAITQGLQGMPLGDRFLLLPENYQPSRMSLKIRDYSQKPDRRSLMVSEEGVIVRDTAIPDLVTPSVLDLWAERTNAFTWRLTRNSVEQALQRGRKLPDLQTFLQERTAHPLPALLLIALKAWTGTTTNASLTTVVLLQCTQPAVLDALLQSRALAPHILGRIGADGILVKSAEADKVKAVLEWAGVQVVARITAS